MKVIFIKDVKGQGKKDDIKEVKDGYAKFLISNSLAVAYTSNSVKVLNNQIDKRKQEEQELDKKNRKEAEKIKEQLSKLELSFTVKTGKEDKVFGSISTKQISEELAKMGYDIDKKKITCDSEINSLGTHEVTITLHKEVVFKLDVILSK